jgi:hypothetical protein
VTVLTHLMDKGLVERASDGRRYTCGPAGDPDQLTARTRGALAVGLAGAVLTGGLAAACQLLDAGAAWPGLIGCPAAFGYLGWRAAWTRPPARPKATRRAGRRHRNAARRRSPAGSR